MATLSLGRGELGETALFQCDGGRPVQGRLDPGDVRRTLDEIAEALARPPGLVLPGDDVQLAAGEARAGAALAALLGSAGMRPVAEALSRWRGRREAQTSAPWLGIDAEGALAALPWELLEGAPPEAGGASGCTIARVSDGHVRPIRPITAVAVRAPVPDDPVCAEVIARTQRAISAAGLPLITVDRDLPHGVVLHLVAHGSVVDSLLGIGGRDGTRLAPDTVRAGLYESLDAADLVVLHVCRSGDRGLADPDLAQRIAARGHVVLAPAEPLDARAASTLADGLYAGLGHHGDVGRALVEARRRVRDLALIGRAGRWWIPTVVVSADPEQVLVPRPTPDAQRAHGRPVWPLLLVGAALVLGWPLLRAATPSPDPAKTTVAQAPVPVIAPPVATSEDATPEDAAAPPTPHPRAPARVTAPPPPAAGQVEARPTDPARMRVGAQAWVAASRVLPARWTLPAGRHAIEVEAGTTSFSCEVDVPPEGTVRICPDPGLERCPCR